MSFQCFRHAAKLGHKYFETYSVKQYFQILQSDPTPKHILALFGPTIAGGKAEVPLQGHRGGRDLQSVDKRGESALDTTVMSAADLIHRK
jgi:hypothetical protein